MSTQHTPGPWEYVPGNEHHGPYVVTDFGTTVADCYAMSNPECLSVRNGGTSRPINHLAEMAEANARLIAAAPDLLEALVRMVDWNASRGSGDEILPAELQEDEVAQAMRAIAKATGQES